MTIPQRVQERRDELMIALRRTEHDMAAIDRDRVAIAAELDGLALADAAYAEEEGWPDDTEAPAEKPARAPRRDIRGMVLDAVRNHGEGVVTVPMVAELVGILPSQAATAIGHWVNVGELRFANGIVSLPKMIGGDPQPLDQAAE